MAKNYNNQVKHCLNIYYSLLDIKGTGQPAKHLIPIEHDQNQHFSTSLGPPY